MTSHSHCISDFTKDDIEPVYAIELASNQHPWSKKILASCIGGRYQSRQIRDNEQLCGFYVADVVIDEMTLMEICIHPDAQGQGLGQILLDDLLDIAKHKQVKTIHLEVRASNLAAHMLYIKNGFTETHRRTGYYPCATGYEDAIVMQRRL
ncbi:ribosomal-protein-alanine N-acetyltransferase [Thalassotalea sp. HSM 43]|uniref:ribosomal protein S18-alanine N-acetyltransferase n=1 Tax=Thalassotalea sp. HSM 43 TaxID=2552945 RepID=UPI001080BE8E|nr:ribosomal protein S18-alanine N-acetyltransferase [Thalassotalea sp. HSM 43]QBY05164.1 ribosomal-protein-alanine N-acetyltransferase [Thalassotalea sp. HSM 43]